MSERQAAAPKTLDRRGDTDSLPALPSQTFAIQAIHQYGTSGGNCELGRDHATDSSPGFRDFRLLVQLRDSAIRITATKPHHCVDSRHVADHIAPDCFAKLATGQKRMALITQLSRHTLLARRLGQFADFVDRSRQGLFAVNVFAHLNGRHSNRGVRVIWRSNDHRVDVLFLLQQLAKIAITSCIRKVFVANCSYKGAVRRGAVSFRRAFFFCVHIAQSRDSGARVLRRADVVTPPMPATLMVSLGGRSPLPATQWRGTMYGNTSAEETAAVFLMRPRREMRLVESFTILFLFMPLILVPTQDGHSAAASTDPPAAFLHHRIDRAGCPSDP